MKTMKKVLCLAFVLMMILTLGACAKKEQTDAEYIKKKGTMVIGITMYPPMNYYEGEELVGFDTEMAIAVCEKLGIKPEFVEINWDSKEVELNAKNIDCIWNGMTTTPERKENMSVSNPYLKQCQVLVMKADRYEEIMANVEGLTLTAEAGSTGEGKVDGSNPDDGTQDVSAKEYFKNTNYVPSDSMAKAIMEVESGTADLAIVDSDIAIYTIGNNTEFKDLTYTAELNFGAQEIAIAFRKGSDMTAQVDKAMADLLADGTTEKIAAKYGINSEMICR